MRFYKPWNITFKPRCLTVTNEFVKGQRPNSKMPKPRLGLSVATNLHYAAHRHTNPRESYSTSRGRRSLEGHPGHSQRCYAPGFLRVVVLVTHPSPLFRRYVVNQETNSQSAKVASARGSDDRGGQGPKGLCLVEWRCCLGRWQAVRCWRRGWGERASGFDLFPLWCPQRWVLPGSPIRTGWSVQPPQTTT